MPRAWRRFPVAVRHKNPFIASTPHPAAADSAALPAPEINLPEERPLPAPPPGSAETQSLPAASPKSPSWAGGITQPGARGKVRFGGPGSFLPWRAWGAASAFPWVSKRKLGGFQELDGGGGPLVAPLSITRRAWKPCISCPCCPAKAPASGAPRARRCPKPSPRPTKLPVPVQWQGSGYFSNPQGKLKRTDPGRGCRPLPGRLPGE